MGYGSILSAAFQGLEINEVKVEADISNGLPSFQMVGYLSSEVKEAWIRVKTAIANSGIFYPPKKTVINLSPGNLRKTGTFFDLPIATAILVALGELTQDSVEGVLMIGELGLDGSVRRVNGIFPVVSEAGTRGIKRCILPKENVKEGRLVEGMEVIGVENLRQVREILSGRWKPSTEEEEGSMADYEEEEQVDFSEIRGQAMVKRAVEVAVAGRHNILFVGPPGSGKSLIARRIPTIFPNLSKEESVELTRIYSIMGLLDEEHPMVRKRPFREADHTATRIALVGGGRIPGPGEITLADKGVLFLDELAEFPRGVLESLRQPLEDRKIRLVRKHGVYDFPADFMLVAATNPCPCGYFPDRNRCKCTPGMITRYMGKISQAFLSRIDICIEVPELKFEDLECKKGMEESSSKIRERVEKAAKIQKQRNPKDPSFFNAALNAEAIDRWCALGEEEEKFMRRAFESYGLSARTYHKVLKVARTIADLDEEENISLPHLQEALAYRMVDKSTWEVEGC